VNSRKRLKTVRQIPFVKNSQLNQAFKGSNRGIADEQECSLALDLKICRFFFFKFALLFTRMVYFKFEILNLAFEFCKIDFMKKLNVLFYF